MVLVGVRRVALLAIGLALGVSGLQACTSAGGEAGRGGSGAPSQPAVETTQITDPAPGGNLVAEQLGAFDQVARNTVRAAAASHLDVPTAAHTQINGKPEEVGSTLAGWASRVVGPPAP